ncbi:hypothetical protein ACRBEV_30430 [Methylobacterium phyllosphaerae]
MDQDEVHRGLGEQSGEARSEQGIPRDQHRAGEEIGGASRRAPAHREAGPAQRDEAREQDRGGDQQDAHPDGDAQHRDGAGKIRPEDEAHERVGEGAGRHRAGAGCAQDRNQRGAHLGAQRGRAGPRPFFGQGTDGPTEDRHERRAQGDRHRGTQFEEPEAGRELAEFGRARESGQHHQADPAVQRPEGVRDAHPRRGPDGRQGLPEGGGARRDEAQRERQAHGAVGDAGAHRHEAQGRLRKLQPERECRSADQQGGVGERRPDGPAGSSTDLEQGVEEAGGRKRHQQGCQRQRRPDRVRQHRQDAEERRAGAEAEDEARRQHAAELGTPHLGTDSPEPRPEGEVGSEIRRDQCHCQDGEGEAVVSQSRGAGAVADHHEGREARCQVDAASGRLTQQVGTVTQAAGASASRRLIYQANHLPVRPDRKLRPTIASWQAAYGLQPHSQFMVAELSRWQNRRTAYVPDSCGWRAVSPAGIGGGPHSAAPMARLACCPCRRP